MEFAYMTHVWGTPPGISVAERYKILWDELEFIDRLGYDYAVTVEHHFNPEESWMTDPTIFCAAGAQRTSRIRFVPMGYIPPLWEPIRLIETIGMLDHLLDGRLEIGLVSGSSPAPFKTYGVDYQTRREMTLETADVLQAAFASSGTFSFKGQFYDYEDVTPAVMPLQEFGPQLWIPSRDDDFLADCARRGINTGYLWFVPRDIARLKFDAYLEEWAKAGHTKSPKISYGGLCYVADTDAEAIARARVHVPNSFRAGAGAPGDDYSDERAEMIRQHYLKRGEPQTAELMLHARDVDWLLEHNLLWAGSPDTVAEQIAQAASESAFNVVTLELNYGEMDRHEVWANVQAFGEGVMPKLRSLEPI